jgi:NAD(P)-dependent dehydrogenase (short-subunit alcohol dehydrogenase family)
MINQRLDGRVAVVTGASKGLGKQMAEALAEAAATVALVARSGELLEGVRPMQELFRENAPRLYHWVEDRRVPADNNYAERQLRPTVIARKTSFGSQSDAGAATREVLMTLVHTLALRFPDPQTHFKSVLDQLAEDPTRDPIRLLFPQDSS